MQMYARGYYFTCLFTGKRVTTQELMRGGIGRVCTRYFYVPSARLCVGEVDIYYILALFKCIRDRTRNTRFNYFVR